MELKKLFIGMMACAAVAACTNDEFVEEKGNEVLNADSYMAINIVSPSSSATRADDFEAGTSDENKVNNAIFFFFDANGNGCAKPTTPTLNFTNGANISDAVIVLTDIIAPPASVVAILNPTEEILALKSFAAPSLESLKLIAENYVYEITTGFMMSNSIYKDANNIIINATAIVDKVFKTAELAKNNPVTIPVERVVAKLNTAISESLQKNIGSYNIYDAAGNLSPVALDVQLNGWLVTDLNPTSYMLKKIDTDPTNFTGWNDIANFRSYWANSYNPGTYDQFIRYNYTAIAANKFNTPDYCLENTNDSTTKLIVAAQVLANNSPIDLIEWRGEKYLKEGMQNLITTLPEIKQYYVFDKEEEEADGTKYSIYKTLSPTDFEFVKVDDTPENQFYVKPSFNLAGNVKIYTVTLGSDNKQVAVEVADARTIINNALVALGKMKLWEDGMCYYYLDIKHTNGASAVIRNHYYKLTINSIKGLGTPVPFSNDVIIPKTPTEGETYIAAKVEILNWRIVNQTVDLN